MTAAEQDLEDAVRDEDEARKQVEDAEEYLRNCVSWREQAEADVEAEAANVLDPSR